MSCIVRCSDLVRGQVLHCGTSAQYMYCSISSYNTYRLTRLGFRIERYVPPSLSLRSGCRCVEEFDHHCPVVANCVGKNNRRKFLVFIVLILLDQILFLRLSATFLSRLHPFQNKGSNESGGFWHGLAVGVEACWWAAGQYPGLILLNLIQVLASSFNRVYNWPSLLRRVRT